jgi:hypothetical protein
MGKLSAEVKKNLGTNRVSDPDPYCFWKLNHDPLLSQKFSSLRVSKLGRGEPLKLNIGAWRLKMEARKVYRSVVADSHHHERSRIQIRIRIEVN